MLIRHSRKWNNENCYANYTIDEIVIKEHASQGDLGVAISKELDIDLSLKSIKIKYKVKGSFMPMEIHNNMIVRVCIELKKENVTVISNRRKKI